MSVHGIRHRSGVKNIAGMTGEIFMAAVERRRVAGKGGDPMSLLQGLIDQMAANGAGGAENDEFHILCPFTEGFRSSFLLDTVSS